MKHREFPAGLGFAFTAEIRVPALVRELMSSCKPCSAAKIKINKKLKKKDSKKIKWAFQVALVVKNPRGNAGDIRNAGSIPGSEDPLEEGMATHSSISCLENPVDRGAWWAPLS